MLRLYVITKAGKRVSGNIVLPQNDQTRVLQYLNEMGRGTTEEVGRYANMSRGRAGAILSRLERRGLVQELTRKDREERYGGGY